MFYITLGIKLNPIEQKYRIFHFSFNTNVYLMGTELPLVNNEWARQLTCIEIYIKKKMFERINSCK